MNRTVKVTGFSLTPAVKHLLCDLFSRVAQVDKVYLSPDKNAAFVQLADKSSVQFVLEQDWELQHDQLKVQCAVPQTTLILKDTDQDKNIFCSGTLSHAARHDSCVLENTASCTDFTGEDYRSGCSQFWADVPHQNFMPVGKAKKRRRHSDGLSCVGGPEKMWHRPKKKKRKRKEAYLESALSVPFGIEHSLTVGDSENKESSCGPQNCSEREIFIRGSETIGTSLPWLSTAQEARHLVAEAAKVPSELLHITVGGRVLTDEVVCDIGNGAILHYTVKGLGGADADQKGTNSEKVKEQCTSPEASHSTDKSETTDAAPVQLSKSALKKQRKKALKQLQSATVAGASEDNTDKGTHRDAGSYQSTGAASSADQSSNKSGQSMSQKEKTSAEPMVMTSVEPEAMAAEAMQVSTTEARENTLPKVARALSRDADEHEVYQWLQMVCRVAPDSLSEFDGMDGKTLYSYPDFESLLADVEISYGKARTVLFLRDFPNRQSKMLWWTTNEVKMFIHEKLQKPNLDLQSFCEKEVDGVVFLSFTDGGELKRDLGLNGVIARRIIAERDAVIKLEEGHADGSLATEDSCLSAPSVSADEGQTESMLNSQREPELLQSEPKVIIVDPKDPSAFHKIFVQNTLHLQCLHLAEDFRLNSLKQSMLKILRVKESSPSLLDKSFLFFILCGPDFQKKAVPSVWKMIKNRTHDLWKQELEQHMEDGGKLETEDTRLLLDGKELVFSKTPTPTLVNLVDFEKDAGKCFDDYLIPVLIVDKQFLKLKENVSERPGYSCKLGSKKDSPVYHFGFEKDRDYWCFDAEDFACSIEKAKVPDSQSGLRERCQLQWNKVEEADDDATVAEPVDSVEPELEPRTGSPRTMEVTENDTEMQLIEDRPNSRKIAPAFSRYVWPRQFKHNPEPFSLYQEGGILDVLESAHGMLPPCVELKYYDSEQDPEREIFLRKSLTFVCGCLNSRRNGTIYFGIPENDVRNKPFQHGEIVGVCLTRHEQDDYRKLFHKYRDQCFPGQENVTAMCVHGPYFVRIKPSSEKAGTEKYVIEIDVEPRADLCQKNYFTFHASHIGKHLKEKNGVYVRDTGIHDGTPQTRRLPAEGLADFVSDHLPAIADQREKEEVSWAHHQKLKVKSEGSKLKQFMEHCDESVYPILVISKPTGDVKQNIENCLKFVKFIPWAAVFDFDDDSLKDGLFCMYRGSPSVKEASSFAVKDFVVKTVEKKMEELNMSSQVMWIFANGNSVDSAFEHLDKREWYRSYYPFIKDAITFLQNPCVIPKRRHHILVLVLAGMEDDIVKTVDDIASFSNIGLDRVFLVFDHEYTQKSFISKSSHSEDVSDRSAVLPLEDVQRIVNEVLDLDKKDKHKNVVTASGSLAPIPPHQWMTWTDLSILSANECEETEPTLKSAKAAQEEIRFYRGGQVSWLNFYLPNQVMERSIQQEIVDQIILLSQNANGHYDIPKVTIYHMPGTGGTTLCKCLLWNRRKTNKCAVIDRITQRTFHQICEFWEAGELSTLKDQWKPVILLSDNTAEDFETTEFELCDKLFRRQKYDRLSKPIAILIICRRSLRHGTDGYGLKQKLSDAREKLWMEQTYKHLEGKNLRSEINTFLGFLSMRHEFDLGKLKDFVVPYLCDEGLSENERALIVYIALIMKYFPPSLGRPGIPVSSCDILLDQSQPWDRTVSGVADAILVREYNPVIKAKIVRIANKAVAGVILKTIQEMDCLSLADIVIDCLHSSLIVDLDQCEHFGSLLTAKIIRSMLIERFTETGSKRPMSPLILDIQQQSGFQAAVEILELGHQQLGGEVFYQQLARFYTNNKQFEDAVKCAEKAVTLCRTDKAEITHTLGNVYLKYFQHQNQSKGIVQPEIQHHKEILKLAIKSFNSLSEAQGTNDAITKSYACCDKIKLINALLSYVIEKLLPPEDYSLFGRFLTENSFKLKLFDELPELKEIMKNVLQAGIDTLRFMYNFGFSHKCRSGEEAYARKFRSRFPMSYTKTECIIQFKTLATTLKRVVPSPRSGDAVPDSSFRIENLKLTGSFYESIFNFVADANQGKSSRQGKCYAKVQQLKANLSKIDFCRMTTEDMDNYITVCLALELLGSKSLDFTLQRSQIYRFCNIIIAANDDYVRTMRAHLYRVLVCWPTWGKSEVYSTPDFIMSFYNKAPFLVSREGPLLPLVHFFVAKPSSRFHLCHWTEIFDVERNYMFRGGKGRKIEEDEEDEEEEDIEEKVNTAMHQKLLPFHGFHRAKVSDGKYQYVVELDMSQYSNKLDALLTIRALRGVKVFRDAEVVFYLGFSLHGPIAYIYQVVGESVSQS